MSTSQGGTSAGTPPNSTRIDYLDGIRGLAALAVIFVHVFEAFGLDQEWAGIISNGRLTGVGIDRFIPIINNITRYGAYAVQIFLVISGYSLMLAIAKSRDGQPKGGLKGYFTRRIRRIWPPYYAALFIGLFLIAVVPGMNVKQNIWWDQALPAFTPDVILSHVFFLHHFSPDWLQKINPAMWTIAIEETIYLLFPFTLLPVWRRFGTLPMVVVGIAVGALSWYVLHPLLQVANPWFLGLFALGALGASFGFSNRKQEHQWRDKIPWVPVGIVSFILFLATDIASKQFFVSQLGFDIKGSAPWITDTLLALAVVSMLIHLTEQWKNKNENRLLRLFQLPPILKLGTFSYSLYLIHPPILTLVTLTIIRLNITSWPAYALEAVVGIPICIIGAYLFHLVFERPFMPTYLAKPEQTVLGTTKVPAQTRTVVEPKVELATPQPEPLLAMSDEPVDTQTASERTGEPAMPESEPMAMATIDAPVDAPTASEPTVEPMTPEPEPIVLATTDAPVDDQTASEQVPEPVTPQPEPAVLATIDAPVDAQTTSEQTGEPVTLQPEPSVALASARPKRQRKKSVKTSR